jgi:chromosome segregation ATPase
MQTMNQSLIALIANGVISFEVAMERSLDPDDLSLRLRKIFPEVEEAQREGKVSPSPADFAHIAELQEIKKLYEEQEDRWRVRFQEKDETIADLEVRVAALQQEANASGTVTTELKNQLEALRAEKDRLVAEHKDQVAKLNERIRELNQQLVSGGKAPAEKPATGFFKR